MPASPVSWSYRCVAFDLDGVIVDTEPLFERSVCDLLEDRGLSLTPELAHRMLGTLERRGVPVAIATSSHREHVDKVLVPHDLLRRFSFVMTCEDVVYGKPDPEIYRKTANRFGHAAAEMIVLEDSPNGLRAAKGAGARCVVIPHSRVPLHDLGLADAVVSSLAADELTALLGLV